jgi:SNF family Na+-dependent transporter
LERGNFSTRLGFILVSAGCAIGLGNVWRFPYITGMYGGASFVLIYLVFLAILGLPIMGGGVRCGTRERAQRGDVVRCARACGDEMASL